MRNVYLALSYEELGELVFSALQKDNACDFTLYSDFNEFEIRRNLSDENYEPCLSNAIGIKTFRVFDSTILAMGVYGENLTGTHNIEANVSLLQGKEILDFVKDWCISMEWQTNNSKLALKLDEEECIRCIARTEEISDLLKKEHSRKEWYAILAEFKYTKTIENIYNRAKKGNVLDKRTNDNYSFEKGDFVRCVNCGETMLVNLGEDTCPRCKKDALVWVDSEHPEVSADELEEYGYIVYRATAKEALELLDVRSQKMFLSKTGSAVTCTNCGRDMYADINVNCCPECGEEALELLFPNMPEMSEDYLAKNNIHLYDSASYEEIRDKKFAQEEDILAAEE